MTICPKCQSNDWKLASFVYSNGTIAVDTKTGGYAAGVGVGTGGIGAGGGVQKASTEGTHQTSAARAAAPPPIPTPPEPKKSRQQHIALMVAVKGLGIAMGVFALYKQHPALAVIAVVLLFVFAKRLNSLDDRAYEAYEEAYAKRLEEYELAKSAYERWEITRVCQRCGTQYVPDHS